MAKTNIFPSIYDDFVLEGMLKKNNLLAQNVARQDMAPPFKQKGQSFTVPVEKSLDDTSTGIAQVADYSTEITPATTNDYDITTYSFELGFGLKESAFEQIRRGTEGGMSSVAKLGTQVGELFGQKIQDWYKSMLTGLFTADGVLVSGNYVDKSSQALNYRIITEGVQGISGELYRDYDKLIVHSAVAVDLANRGFVTLFPATDFAVQVAQGGQGVVKKVGGLTLVENDTLCAASDGVYPSYVVSGSPFYLGWQRQLRTLDWVKPNIGGGTYEKYWYMDLGLALNGINYNTTSQPTTDLFETAGTWELVVNAKKVGLIRIDSIITDY